VALLVDALVGHRLTYRPPTERSTTRVSALSKLRGRTTADNSIDARVAENNTRSAAAVHAFLTAADELDAVVENGNNLAAELQYEIDRLDDLQMIALDEVEAASTVAARLRALVA
jgi:hypothetical protein